MRSGWEGELTAGCCEGATIAGAGIAAVVCGMAVGRWASFVRAGPCSSLVEVIAGAAERLEPDGAWVLVEAWAADCSEESELEADAFSTEGVARSLLVNWMTPTAAAVPARTVIGMIFLMATKVRAGWERSGLGFYICEEAVDSTTRFLRKD